MDEIDFATERMETFNATALRAVLQRLDAPPSTGICRSCDAHIEPERLAANPQASLCRDCALDEEASRQRAKRCGPR
jgi:RNA polymerase-binding transcription factor DksA